MAKQPKWTQEEIDLLYEMWGTTPIPIIAKTLGRSITAIDVKAHRFSLGPFLEGSDDISFNQLLKSLGQAGSYRCLKDMWRDSGLRIRQRKVKNCYFNVVNIDDFWRWAKKNPGMVNFARFNEYALGAEPDWVQAKRKHDCQYAERRPGRRWTEKDEDTLVKLFYAGWSYGEIAEILDRTYNAVKNRLYEVSKARLRQRAQHFNQQ